MKRFKATAIAVSLLPLYGCASMSSFSDLNPFDGLFRPERTAPTAPAKAAADVRTQNGPQDVESAILEAQNARKEGDLNKAAHILSQLVLFSSDDARVLAEYGKTLAGLGRSDDAVAFLERATQLSPSDWSLYSALGVAYDQKGNYQAAQSLYDRALVLKPGEVSVLNNAALSHMQAGDLDGAEKLLHQIAPSAPDYARISQNLALIEKLKASQLEKPVPADTPSAAAAAAPASAPAISEVEPASPTPVIAPAEGPAVLPAPIAVAEEPSPAAPKEPIASLAQETRAVPERLAKEPAPEIRGSDLASPKREFAGVPHELPPKQAVPKVIAVPSPKPAVLESAAAVPAAKPVAQSHAVAGGTYYVQAGAFSSPDRAGLAVAGLEQLGAHVMSGTVQGRPIFRVRIGPFRNAAQAQTAIEQVQALGRKDVIIVKEFQGA